MRIVFTIYVLFFFHLIVSNKVFGKDISKIKLDSIQIIELQELSLDSEYKLLETFDEMKRYINFNFPSLKNFELEEISYMIKAINPLHYRHLSRYKNKESFFRLSSEKMYEFREEAMAYWIKSKELEKNEILVENIISFNTLIFADAYLSKIDYSVMDNKEYIDAEMFDDILFGQITRNDYMNYLNFVILNSNQLLFKAVSHE